MKKWVLSNILVAFCAGILWFSCESRKPEEAKTPDPQVFNPVEEEADKTSIAPADTMQPLQEPEISSEKTAPKPMPTEAELEKITPSQEARRELNNDAMKAAQMKPEKFVEYMKTRIPYYRGKGNLKAENDMVRIQITEKEMQVETMKGKQTFSMQ